jgi:hypothetical protein
MLGYHATHVCKKKRCFLRPHGLLVKWLNSKQQEAIVVFDPIAERHTRYETYFPDTPAHYSKTGCEKLSSADRNPGASEESAGSDPVSSDLGAQMYEDVICIDDDDEWEDVTSHVSSGVADILVTGEVGECVLQLSVSLILAFKDGRKPWAELGPLHPEGQSKTVGWSHRLGSTPGPSIAFTFFSPYGLRLIHAEISGASGPRTLGLQGLSS